MFIKHILCLPEMNATGQQLPQAVRPLCVSNAAFALSNESRCFKSEVRGSVFGP